MKKEGNMKGVKISNVEIYSRHDLGKVSLGCVHNGASYHVWMDPGSGVIDETIYKNPQDPKRPGKTLKLKAKTAPMQALIAAMLEVYHRDGLLQKFEERAAKGEEERVKNANAEWAKRVKQEAGEDLYNVLKCLLEAIKSGHDTKTDVDMASSVLAKVDKKIKE